MFYRFWFLNVKDFGVWFVWVWGLWVLWIWDFACSRFWDFACYRFWGLVFMDLGDWALKILGFAG